MNGRTKSSRKSYCTKVSLVLLLAVAMGMNRSRSNEGNNNKSRKYPRMGLVGALSPAAPPRRNWLVVDFDGTCTQRDTIAMLPRLASLAAQPNRPRGDDSKTPTAAGLEDFSDRLAKFSVFEGEYFRRYSEVRTSLDARDFGSSKIPEDPEIRFDRLAESIDRLDDVSTEITHQISDSKVLSHLGGLDHGELLPLLEVYLHQQEALEGTSTSAEKRRELQQCLLLRDGCLSVLQGSHRRNYNIGVLSINWFPTLIETLLVRPLCTPQAGGDQSSEKPLPKPVDVPIWCNSVDAKGLVELPFPGAISKQDQIRKLQQPPQPEGAAIRVVYVGDSSTDLLAILRADVGILLGGSESTIALAARFGFGARPLGEFAFGNDNDCNSFVVWTARDWDEIGTFLDRWEHDVPELSSTS